MINRSQVVALKLNFDKRILRKFYPPNYVTNTHLDDVVHPRYQDYNTGEVFTTNQIANRFLSKRMSQFQNFKNDVKTSIVKTFSDEFIKFVKLRNWRYLTDNNENYSRKNWYGQGGIYDNSKYSYQILGQIIESEIRSKIRHGYFGRIKNSTKKWRNWVLNRVNSNIIRRQKIRYLKGLKGGYKRLLVSSQSDYLLYNTGILTDNITTTIWRKGD